MWSHPGKDSEELKIVYFPFLERWHNCFCFWQIMVLYFSTLLRKCKYTSKNYFVLAVHVFMVCLHVTINHMYYVSKNQLCAFFGPAIEIPCCNYLSLLLSYTVGLLLAVLCSYCTKIVTLFLFFFNRLLLVTWTRSLMSTIIQWKRCAINFALVKGLMPNFLNFFWSSRLEAWNAFINTNVLSFEQWKNCLCNSLLYTRCKKQIHLVEESTKRKIQQVSFWSVIFEFLFLSPSLSPKMTILIKAHSCIPWVEPTCYINLQTLKSSQPFLKNVRWCCICVAVKVSRKSPV